MVFQNTNVITTAQANTTATAALPISIAAQSTPVDVSIMHIGGKELHIHSAFNYQNLYGLPVDIRHHYDK